MIVDGCLCASGETLLANACRANATVDFSQSFLTGITVAFGPRVPPSTESQSTYSLQENGECVRLAFATDSPTLRMVQNATIMTVFPEPYSGISTVAVAWQVGMFVAAAVALLVLMSMGWRVVRGTTLVGPWGWLVMSLVGLGLYAALDRDGSGGAADPVRLLVGTLTLCPGVCLLGAKRPQDQAWHFIVTSLWLVLALPALQSLVMGQGGELEQHSARAWFLFGLWAFTLLNSTFSRYAAAVLLAGLGQAMVLAPFLPWPLRGMSRWSDEFAIACYALAILLGCLLYGLSRRETSGLNKLWRDFRNAFGVVWTLRLAERLNATAQANNWDVSASWSGFHNRDGTAPTPELPPDQARAFRQTLSNLLRRFVNEDWIAHRVGESSGSTTSEH